MADEETAVVSNEEATPPAEGGDDGGKPSPRKRKLPLLPLTAIFYAGMVFASSLFTQYVLAPKASAWLMEKEIAKLSEVEEEVLPFGAIYLIEDLVVNPAGSGGTRYLCVSLGFEASEPATVSELETRDAQVKDVLIRIFGSKSVPELIDVELREAMRGEIRESVDSVLHPHHLDGVYFVNFVLQ